MGLNFSKNELVHVRFTSELKNFVAYCVFIVLHDFNLTYYSSIILGYFSILLFPKLCWHIGLTPSYIFTTSIFAIFTSTCHPKQLNPWPNSPASYVVIYSQLFALQAKMGPFKGYSSTCVLLTGLRKGLSKSRLFNFQQ